MGVPKKRCSKSRKKSRVSQDKLLSPILAACPQCKAPIMSHFACPKCGYYRGKQVVIVKEKGKKKKKETG
ncbi:MAG: 50S ribosomal protein L32 [Candidatus Aerophobus sp.]|nr:MAG: 50S ribosomal protein L32 [Candidatus Aerophobus sp.]